MSELTLVYVLGFLLGRKSEQDDWHVKIKDPTSKSDGAVLKVASFRGGEDWPAKGLNVRFSIGTRDGHGDRKIPYAIDVHPVEAI